MAWESRTQTQYKYLYLSYRDEQGKARKKYVGRRAQVFKTLYEYELRRTARQLGKQIVCDLLDEMNVGEALLQEHENIILEIAPCFGVHNPKGRGWRSMKTTTLQHSATDEKNSISIERGNELITEAKQGNAAVVSELRAFLLQNPNFRVKEGNLPLKSQLYWIGKLTQEDLYLRECLVQETGCLKQKLRSEGSGTVLEELYIEQISTLHLQLHYVESVNTKMQELPDPNGKLKTERQLQIVRQNHLSAIESLAKIRKLLAPKVRNAKQTDG